jgi:hypothetical protein
VVEDPVAGYLFGPNRRSLHHSYYIYRDGLGKLLGVMTEEQAKQMLVLLLRILDRLEMIHRTLKESVPQSVGR